MSVNDWERGREDRALLGADPELRLTLTRSAQAQIVSKTPHFHFIRGGLWTPNPTKERVTSPIGLQTNQYVNRIEFYHRISNPVMLGSTLVVHHGVGRTVTRQRNVTSSAIKRKAAKQVAVSRTITSKPNQLDAVQRLCQEIYDHALASSAERDIKSFDFWKEPEEPVGIRARSSARPWPDARDVYALTRNSNLVLQVFHFYEVYESDTAFTDYYNTEEMKAFLKNLEPLVRNCCRCRCCRSLAHSLTR